MLVVPGEILKQIKKQLQNASKKTDAFKKSFRWSKEEHEQLYDAV